MVVLKFEIRGNQDNQIGNPIPKLKMTGKQQWMPQAQRYSDWKMFVTSCLLRTNPPNEHGVHQIIDPNVDYRPITLPDGWKARMDIFIEWHNNARPDPENVFGSIADALFVNDKHLAGSFDFHPVPTGIGRVDVKITLWEIEPAKNEDKPVKTDKQIGEEMTRLYKNKLKQLRKRRHKRTNKMERDRWERLSKNRPTTRAPGEWEALKKMRNS